MLERVAKRSERVGSYDGYRIRVRAGRRDREWERRRRAQAPVAACQLLGPMARTGEAVIANPVKAQREHVEQEAANEFSSRECYRLHGRRGSGAVILVGKAHRIVVDVADPIVGGGDAIGCSGDVLQDLLWTSKHAG
jgi:hypothetical protein